MSKFCSLRNSWQGTMVQNGRAKTGNENTPKQGICIASY